MHLLSMKLFIFAICAVNLVQNSVLAFSQFRSNSQESVTDNFASGLEDVYRAYKDCEKVTFGELLTCLKLRALKLADRLLRSESLQVLNGVNIVKSSSNDADRNGRSLNFEPIPEVNEAVLPTDPQQKQHKLNEMLAERVTRFFQTHSFRLDMPRFVEESKQLLDGHTAAEGRKKKEDYGPLLIGGLFKGGMLALGLKGVALLAGKALLAAKIALVVAAVVGLSSLLSSGHGGGKTTYEVVSHPHVSHVNTYSSDHIVGGHDHSDSGDHGHYKRSVNVPDAAMHPHLLAYRRQHQSRNP